VDREPKRQKADEETGEADPGGDFGPEPIRLAERIAHPFRRVLPAVPGSAEVQPDEVFGHCVSYSL
jgi:hypothetical protein